MGVMGDPVFFCLRSSCYHVTERAVKLVRLTPKILMQNDRDFEEVILLYVTGRKRKYIEV
jgi:hypothetical protein